MKLYIFDSCPFCVRVRALIGFKQIDCDLEYLVAGEPPQHLLDRVERFTVPMLEFSEECGEIPTIMQESDDILRYLDQIDQQPVLDCYEVSEAVFDWLNTVSASLDPLCYPRMRLIDLPELGSSKARSFFEVSRKERLGMSLDQALEQTDRFVAEAESQLIAVQSLVDVEGVLEGARTLMIDDLYLFPVLRNLGMVHELKMPDTLRRYLEYLSRITAVSLYPQISRLDFESERAVYE